MLNIINKHLTELSDEELLQSLIHIIKSHARVQKNIYDEKDLIVFFDYIGRNVLSKEKHKNKITKIINYIHSYKNSIYHLQPYPIFVLFIRNIYNKNIFINYDLKNNEGELSCNIFLQLLVHSLSLAEFKKFILKNHLIEEGLIFHLKTKHLSILTNIYNYNSKLTKQYFKWLFEKQAKLNIDLLNYECGFDIWLNYTGEKEYNSLIKWCIKRFTLEQMKKKFSYWHTNEVVYLGDYLLLNGNEHNIKELINQFKPHLKNIFKFSPTNTLCSNETIKIKFMVELYSSLLEFKNENIFFGKNDLFSFIDSQNNVYIEDIHEQFIKRLYQDGNQLLSIDDYKRNALTISLTSNKQCRRIGLFKILWPYAKNEGVNINQKNAKGQSFLHLILSTRIDNDTNDFYLYLNSGDKPFDVEESIKRIDCDSYLIEHFELLNENGFDFNITNNNKNNALHLALALKHKEKIILKLIDLGVSLVDKNNFQQSAFDYLNKYRNNYSDEFYQKIKSIYEKEIIEKYTKNLSLNTRTLKL